MISLWQTVDCVPTQYIVLLHCALINTALLKAL